MTFIFRTRIKYFLLELVFPLVAILVLIAVALYLTDRPLFPLAVVLCTLLAGLVIIRFLLPAWLSAWKSRIIIDNDAFMCRINDENYRIEWSNVLAAQIRTSADYVYLYLGAAEDFPLIPLHCFDGPAVWNLVQSRVDAAALARDAILKVPSYQEWAETSAEIIRQVKTPLSSRYHTSCRYLGWGCTIFFGYFLISATSTGQAYLSFLFLVFVLLGVFLTMAPGEITVSENDIVNKTSFGIYRIRWSEVERMETGHIYEGFVFHGDGKRLVVPGSDEWSKKTRQPVIDYINAEIEQRQIPVESTVWAAFKSCKNTRMR